MKKMILVALMAICLTACKKEVVIVEKCKCDKACQDSIQRLFDAKKVM